MQKKYYYLNIFFLFSCFGFILETIFIKNYQSGILYLPWTPIYGIGILLAVFLNKQIKTKNHFIRIFLLFTSTMIVLSLLELMAGYLIESVFHRVYWNYTDQKYNYGKYISLESALIWGVGSIISLYIFIPLINIIEKFIPKWITIILSTIFISDLIVTYIVNSP